MYSKDGLYMSHGTDGTVLTIIVEDNRKTLWVRNFATKESVLDILEDDVLSGHDRSGIASHLSAKKGFYTDNYNEPEDGFKGCAFLKYILEA
jgi:hypothetical protein